MSRKRGKQRKTPVEAVIEAAIEAVPDDVLAEGSGPVRRVDTSAIATVEDVVTTDDIATTDDVITADDVVATTTGLADEPAGSVDGAGSPGPCDAVDPGSPEAGGAGAARADVAGADTAGLDAAGADAADAAANGAVAEAADPAGLDRSAQEGDADGDPVDPVDGDDPAIVFPTSAASLDPVQLKYLIEALIFASDRPLTVQRLRQLTRVGDVRRIEQAVAELTCDHRERGMVLQQVSGGYQFRTRTQFSPWVQQLIAGRPVRLSRAQLETLAIIAYRQPITRPEIDDIRGVDSSATLKLLIDRMLIRVLGKREEVGRPMLYGTTKEFLDFFSLGDLRELPTLREYSELTDESRKVMSDRFGIAPDGDAGGPGADGGGDGGDGGDGGGGGDGGDGEGSGEGGDGGAMPCAGDDGGGILSDDGAPPASASAAEVSEAIAAFWAAADAVERSDAVAIAEAESEDEDGTGGDAEAGGRVDDDLGDDLGAADQERWPAGSRRFAIRASEPGDSPRGGGDGAFGDAAAGPVRAEPAAE